MRCSTPIIWMIVSAGAVAASLYGDFALFPVKGQDMRITGPIWLLCMVMTGVALIGVIASCACWIVTQCRSHTRGQSRQRDVGTSP